MTEYAELHCHSTFSLLDGASSPESLAEHAQRLGLAALALTDHDSLAGAVRFWAAARRAGIHPVFGAEVALVDSDTVLPGSERHLTLLAETQEGYASLCRLLTLSHLDVDVDVDVDATSPKKEGKVFAPPWPGKTAARLSWGALEQHSRGLLALSGCRRGPVSAPLLHKQPERAAAAAEHLRDLFGPDRLWIELQHHCLPDDDRLASGLLALAGQLGLPCVITNDVHYAARDFSRLRDALIAIDHNQSLPEARQAGRLPLNSTYALAPPGDLERRFACLPPGARAAALRASLEIAERCQVALDFSGRRLPHFPTPDGKSEFACLYQLCHDNLARRFAALTPAVLNQLAHELDAIERAGLAGYFLIVWDIVRFARERGIRCQGRGSAANSIVAYLLGITSVDPLQHHLLFERFLSPDRHTAPDIDIDFAADRREEVIQYAYGRYGADHCAMVCNVVTFQARSAVRDLGKALEFPPPVVERLVKSLDTHSPSKAADALLDQVEKDAPPGGAPDDHPLNLLAGLLRQIEGCPRHLSIHVGGMLITGPPLCEIVPLERATMPGRVVCQWDKNSVEDAGLIKIDLLSLRTLGMLSEAVTYLDEPVDIDALPLDDPALYVMLQRADTLGTFQVESRVQQQMLPRLKPACFEDIVAEVAIMRPGPIQGGAVHPYLRRRKGEEPVAYAHPCLEPALKETLGVLLFQEQAIRVAMAAAGFTPGEADALRRALTRYDYDGDPSFRSNPVMAALRERFMAGAIANGLPPEVAASVFQQLAAFAGYSFCKSHAASFALIAYQTLWLKHYHPAAFYCALLNHQPMGYYAPEVIVGDARRHGIGLLPPDINRSGWGYTIERRARADATDPAPPGTGAGSIVETPDPAPPGTGTGARSIGGGLLSLQIGLQTVAGLGESGWRRIRDAREAAPFADLREVCVRARLPQSTVSDLIRTGAMDAFGERRRLLWELGEIDYRPEELPLVAPVTPAELPELDEAEQMAWEYELLGLSPAGQMMQHYRPALRRAGVLSAAEARAQRGGRRVRVAGLPMVRHRPGTAKGIVFIALEDETGLIDLVVRPDVYQRCRDALRHQPVVLVDGVVQAVNGAISVLVTHAS